MYISWFFVDWALYSVSTYVKQQKYKKYIFIVFVFEILLNEHTLHLKFDILNADKGTFMQLIDIENVLTMAAFKFFTAHCQFHDFSKRSIHIAI